LKQPSYGVFRKRIEKSKTRKDRFSMDAELDRLKAVVNLVEYVAAQGYWVDKRKSCRRTTVMRHDNGDKIIISQGKSCSIYFSARDTTDNGTIVDFIQKRMGLNLGQTKTHLRQWLGEPRPVLVEKKYRSPDNSKRNIEKVKRYLNSTKPISNTTYLQSRCITPDVIYSPRFNRTIRQDSRGNTVFLHRNIKGICGAELKNNDFTGCPKDSLKGIWHSNLTEDDNRLILCESSIDNLSYHILHGQDLDRHISLAGNFSPEQEDIVKRAIARMPSGSTIVAAFDNDAEGHKYNDKVKTMVPTDKNFERHTPQKKDWNADLKALHQPSQNMVKQHHRPSMVRF
jgi:hypothetical protein